MIRVLCVRGSGDMPSEPVIDGLLDTAADAAELGRNLINNGEALVKVSQTIVGDHSLMPGDVGHVTLESGTVVSYQITGVAHGYVDGIPATILTGVMYEPDS